MAQNGKSLPVGFDKLLDDFYIRLEERDRWSDHSIRFLFAGNGGGIALVMTYAGVLTNSGRAAVSPLGWPLALFATGLLFVGIQIFISSRTVRIGRRAARLLMKEVIEGKMGYAEAFVAMSNPVTFPSKWRRSWLLTLFSFSCFIAGLIASFVVIANVHVCRP